MTRVVAGGRPADFQAVGNVVGKSVAARHESKTLVDRGPDEETINRIAMFGQKEHPDGVSPPMAMEDVPAGGVRDNVNGRLGASRATV